MVNDGRKEMQDKEIGTRRQEETHREIMRLAEQGYNVNVRIGFAPEPSRLRIVDTVTTYGAYQKPI